MLEKIIINKKKETMLQREAVSIPVLEQIIRDAGYSKRSFREALLHSSSGIISEFKRKSPSKGWIFKDARIDEVIPSYEQAGAAAISVLTDEQFFGGTFDDFRKARELVSIPLLRKDFVIDAYQIYQARAMKADVVLLIASALSPEQVKKFTRLAHDLDMEVLLEIHKEEELDYIHPDVDVIGINNRNLATFVTDVQTSFELGEKIPAEFIKISESGISDPDIVCQLQQAGFNGFLMGENFMKTSDPGGSLKQFINQMKKD